MSFLDGITLANLTGRQCYLLGRIAQAEVMGLPIGNASIDSAGLVAANCLGALVDFGFVKCAGPESENGYGVRLTDSARALLGGLKL